MKIGDNVRVGGRGPVMTIVDIGKYNYIDEPQAKCVWFTKDRVQQEEVYKLEALKIVPDNPDPKFPSEVNTWE